jgi:hypothetical protein
MALSLVEASMRRCARKYVRSWLPSRPRVKVPEL